MSVIICTRNRSASLSATLSSILADRYDGRRQVLVIDNGSMDDTASVVQGIARQTDADGVEYHLEPAPGKSRALNTGLERSTGSVLLFTDDDVTVGPGWSAHLVRGVNRHEDVVAAGGRTLPRWPRQPPQWMTSNLAGQLGLRDLGDTGCDVSATDILGANMAIRKNALGLLRFDPRLGPRAQLRLDCEETAVLSALAERGRLVYEPDAVVFHHVAPDRLSKQYFRRQFLQRGFGHSRMLGRHSQRSRLRDLASGLRLFGRASKQRFGSPGAEGTPAAFESELGLYAEAGVHLESALYGTGKIADWVAAHLL